MKQIAFNTQASQDKFELWKLLELLKLNPPKKILEIGVDKGFLCKTWLDAFPKAEVIGVDNNEAALQFNGFLLLVGDSHDPDVRNRTIDHGPQYDLIFIDGDHTYEGVRKDFEMYGPLITPGGIIAFHDIKRYPGQYEGVEVMKFWDECRQKWANIEIWNGVLNKDAPGIGCLFL